MVHSKKKFHQCTWSGCKKGFTQSGSLKRHSYTHTEERPYRCTWEGCTKRYSIKSRLRNHHKKHVSEECVSCVGVFLESEVKEDICVWR